MSKILLIGVGYWGKNWYNTIINSYYYKLTAVVDPKPAIPIDIPLFNKLEDVDVDFTHAIIATPVEFHLYTFSHLVNGFGIKPENILVEKPCGRNALEASLMKKAYPGFIFLHDPIYQYIKDNIDDLGKILSFNSIRASMGPRIRTDVSIIEDYLIHDLYIFGDLFGFENIHDGAQFQGHHFKSPIQTSDTNIFFTKHNIDGSEIGAKMFSSWWWPLKERKIVIIGTKGSFIWENNELQAMNEYYEAISGIDDFGNVGYKLVQDSPGWRHYRYSTFTSKSNLELELEAFMENKKPFSDKLTMKVWRFMETI